MKYLILIGDGMSDWPLQQLDGKTPLEAAKTPNLDFLARNGVCGWTSNIPPRMEPGSDVAALSIFGYDPKKYYTGRGPLEAASLGVKMGPKDLAFRCNLVTVVNGKMESFTAHHIETREANKIIEKLNREIGSKGIKFYPGLSYRHLLVVDRAIVSEKVQCVPPHDITNKAIGKYLPKGKGAEALVRLMNESTVILHESGSKATMIWPWGQGRKPLMPSFKQKYGKRAAVITAVHLLKGLGRILGMEVINVPGATGYLDTNYKGKADQAVRALKRNDLVIVHVEAPDEAGHEGSVEKKVKAIEDFDRQIVGSILSQIRDQASEFRLLIMPDHPTPIKIMTHSTDPVPFLIYPLRLKNYEARVNAFNETQVGRSTLKIEKGSELMKKFLSGKL